MKKFLSILLSALMLVTTLTFPAAAAASNSINYEAEIKFTEKAPSIDGVVKKGEYGTTPLHSYPDDKSQFVDNEHNDYDESDWDFDFYATWDKDNLYIAWVLNTETHICIPEKDFTGDGSWGEGDYGYMWMYSCVQFIITPGAPKKGETSFQTGAYSGNYLEAGIALTQEGNQIRAAWTRPTNVPSIDYNDWDVVIVRDEDKKTTTYEVRVSWENCGLKDVSNGTQFGLTYAVAAQKYEDKRGMIEWQNCVLSNKDADSAAVITLTDANNEPELPPVEDEPTLDELLGEAPADPKFDLVIDAPEYFFAGDNITVTVTIENITAPSGLHLVEFVLNYDNEKLLITNDIDEEEDNALVCIENLPKDWENFCSVANDYNANNEEGTTVNPLNDGVITATVFTAKNQAKYAITADGALVFTFTFTALEDSECAPCFVIPHANVEGALNTNAGADKYEGNGTYGETHAATILHGYDPGCTSEGLTDGLICLDCEYTLVEPEIIPATGHGEGEWVTVLEPGIGTTGLAECYCTICGDIIDTMELPALCRYGDLTKDDVIDKFDYILLKRAVLGTFVLDDVQNAAADVNQDGTVDKFDYILVKRHVMGTYVIESPQAMPQFTDQYLTADVHATDRITDSDAIPFTGVNTQPSYGAIIIYTPEYGAVTPTGLKAFHLAVFEYDPNCFGYVHSIGYGTGYNDVPIPEDGFVIAIHPTQALYIDRLLAIPDNKTVFVHGVHMYTGNDFTVNHTETAPVIDGVIDNAEWKDYLVGEVVPSNTGWSYVLFEQNNYHTTAKYYATYDNDNFYVAIEVDTPTHHCPINSSSAGSMWMYSSIQMNLSSQAPDSDYIAKNFEFPNNQTAVWEDVVKQYGFAANNSNETLCCNFTGNSDTQGISSVVRRNNDGTTVYEIAIPFSKIGITAEQGTEFGWSFATNSEDWKSLFLRDGGGIIKTCDFSKMMTVTLG